MNFDVSNFVSKRDIEKGQEFPSRKVHYIGTNLVPFGQVHNFVVNSEHTTRRYIVKVTIENNQISDVDCTCPQFLATDSCKHVAAVFYKFQDQFLLSEDSTEEISKNLLKQIKNIARHTNPAVKQEVHIVPYLKYEEYRSYYRNDIVRYSYELRFKIGCDKLYMLGSKTKTFLERYHYGGTISFGKNFSYSKENYYFDAEGKKLISFLDFQYSRLYGNDAYLIPIASNMEELFSIVDHIYVEKIGINRELPVVKGMPFQFKMIKKDDTYILNLENASDFIQTIVSDYHFLIDNQAVYQLTDAEALIAKSILEDENRTFSFSQKSLKEVKDYLIPNIKNNVELDSSIDDIIITKTPSVKLYFDILENYIECKIVFDYDGIEITYLKTKNSNVVRDSNFEMQVYQDILSYGFDDALRLYDVDLIGDFLDNKIDELSTQYEIFTSQKLKETNLIKKVTGTTSFGIGQNNVLNYEFQLENVNPDELDDIFSSLQARKKYFRLKNGNILNLTDPSVQEIVDLKQELDLDGESGEIPKFKALYLDSLKSRNRFIRTDSIFDQFVHTFQEYQNVAVSFTADEEKLLRPYQKEGVKWLYNLYKCGLGGILADEMGLGKSLQTIIFLKRVLEEDPKAKILIVCPTALVYNWDNEFHKFCDSMSRSVFTGMKKERRKKLSWYEGNVYITSYGLVREDLEIYQQMNFKVMVIDEAQNIKNPTVQLTKAVKSVHSELKLALTGTPVENSIIELWSIFDYIMPGFLGNHSKFTEKYKISDEFDDSTNLTLEKLRSQVRPFILRRKKNEVLKDLPDKIENNIYIELSDEEKKIYAALIKQTQDEMEELLKGGFAKNKILILSLLTRLRQVCIDPKIVFENYKGSSSKIENLMNVVKELISNGHKILLFTSFKTALYLVKDAFSKNNISSYVIDGSVPSKQRQNLVNRFNQDDTNVFLIMLKSGGTGLNLTSADVVIHLDLWWNPQAENQATDRAHRIGQKKTVEVIKLITKGTIEEKILKLQEKKKILSDKLIENDGDEYRSFQNLSVEDIKELLRYNNE